MKRARVSAACRPGFAFTRCSGFTQRRFLQLCTIASCFSTVCPDKSQDTLGAVIHLPLNLNKHEVSCTHAVQSQHVSVFSTLDQNRSIQASVQLRWCLR